jgi:uncharacterized protein YjaG (DUF416 family)
MTNGQLQTYIKERMRVHSQLVCRPLGQKQPDVYNEITEALESVWERVSLGDEKRDCFGLSFMLGAVQEILVIPRDQGGKLDPDSGN